MTPSNNEVQTLNPREQNVDIAPSLPHLKVFLTYFGVWDCYTAGAVLAVVRLQSGDLESMKYSFFVITPRSTLTLADSTC